MNGSALILQGDASRIPLLTAGMARCSRCKEVVPPGRGFGIYEVDVGTYVVVCNPCEAK